MSVFDRTWYGRVLVERVEKLAAEEEWRRAYGEIAAHERMQCDDGMILVKLFLHISSAEQKRRFEARAKNPVKAWKLTDDDWRNRRRRKAYAAAIEDMLEATDSPWAPWHLVEGDDKRWARVKVIETVIAQVEAAMLARGLALP
jgi:polyphosphate kinase 2 (PPK2 family)